MPVRAVIADDSIFIRDLIRRHLQRIGCEVVGEAENAAQTVSLFRTLHPDLVTLDVVMAETEGIDSLAALRTIHQEAPDTPVIVMSAVPFDESRETFISSGALDYIVKPFNNATFEQIRRKLGLIFPELKNGRSAGHGADDIRR
jgi:two-component system, chemotaxis family, chemotaxis protein CheY